MASLCSLLITTQSFYSDQVADQSLGDPCLATWGTALDGMLYVRGC